MAKKERLSLDELLEQSLVEYEDKPYDVPSNWAWAKLNYLVDIKTGKKDANYGEENGKYHFFTCASEPIRCNGYSFEGESILLAGNGANVGLALYYDGKFEAYQRTYVLQALGEEIYLKYIYYHLFYFWKEYNNDKQYGSATNYIKLGNIQEYSIPLSPLPEQQRIVDLIESLFDKLDRAKELVQNALDSFEERKSAILHRAFTGELTAKWRNKSISSIEHTAISILDTIKEYKAGKSKPLKKSISISIDAIPFDVPDDWIWCCIDDIQEVSGGIQKTPQRKPDKKPIPYLGVANVRRGYLDLAQVKEFEVTDEEIEKYSLKCDDILVIEGNGSLSEIGRCAIWKGEIKPCVHQNHIIKIRNYCNLIISEYVLYYLNSSIGMELMKLKANTTAGLYNLSTGKIKEIVVPIPSLEEQQEIVRTLDNLLENEKRAKELCDVIDNIDLMKKSILARAFRGELSTNNPNEESALELLKEVLRERIIS